MVPSATHNGIGWVVSFALFNMKEERDLWESRGLRVFRLHASATEMRPRPSLGGCPLPWAQAGFSVHINSGIHRALGASGSFGLREVMYESNLMYRFPIAAVTNSLKLSGLKQHMYYLSAL